MLMQDILAGLADHAVSGSVATFISTRCGREWSFSYHVSPEYAQMSKSELEETLWGHPDDLVRNAIRLELAHRELKNYMGN